MDDRTCLDREKRCWSSFIQDFMKGPLFNLGRLSNQRNIKIREDFCSSFWIFVFMRVCVWSFKPYPAYRKHGLINKESSHTHHNTPEKSLAVEICSLRVPALYLQSPSSQKRSPEPGGTAVLKPHDPAQETMPASVYHGPICISDVNHPKGRARIMQVT